MGRGPAGEGRQDPLSLLLTWIDESYETVAATALPKRKSAAAPKFKR
jgi:predicted DNA-binding protein (MmcQ/YjbR family)